MKKDLTELVFILDRSGSMCGLEQDTIGGFNAMIGKQKKQAGEANVTTVLFDDRYDIIHDRFPIEVVGPLTEKEYYVRGCTALLDAVGKTLHKVENIQEHLPEEMKAEKVIFVITTDGLENASREFLFLGANMDAVSEAKKFGIDEDRSVTYENDSVGVAMNYRVVEEAICCMRSAPRMSDVDGSWKQKIEEDFNRRNRERKEKK